MKFFTRLLRTLALTAVAAAAAVCWVGCGGGDSGTNSGGNETGSDTTGNNNTGGNTAHTHTWGDWVVTTEPTCTTAGMETRTCTQDASHTETREVAKLSGAACEPAAHVHTWGEWVITTAPTCDAPGVETRTCTQDASHKETREVAKLSGAACVVKGEFTDARNGQTYKTVKIGDQTWMAENINVVTEDSKNYSLLSDSSWCYGKSADSCAKYGRLYTWTAAKMACQSIGWRLPDTADWNRLVEVAGGWLTAGKKLKSSSGWDDADINGTTGNGTDDFGFSALPGGATAATRNSFSGVGALGYWWTASEYNTIYGCHASMLSYSDLLIVGCGQSTDKNSGFSVRCIHD